VKRSASIKLVLAGGVAAGALSGCTRPTRVSPDSVYPNDYQVPGAGYYHAPFHAFYPLPYNARDQVNGQYYYGGQWGPGPHQSIINVSAPTAEAAAKAEAARTDVSRGGFGSIGRSSGSHIWS
jgi:hypothetical protein